MTSHEIRSTSIKLRGALKPQSPPTTPSTIELPAGHQKRPGCRPLPGPIVFDRDQILTLRDGTRIRIDIYRPVTEQKVPAIVMWGPYGKSGAGLLNISSMPLRAGIPEERLSGYENFEGLDPAEWVPRGYAVVNVDPRGVNDSEGDIMWWGTQEGRDGHDAIEEIAKLDWCTGKVGLAGNSWLAISQYFIAAQRPPHLACIAPLEGLGDPAREETFRGGIPNTQFSQSIAGILSGRQQQEDWPSAVESLTTFNECVENKRAEMTRIEVPAYIGASYSTEIHTIGSLRAFEEIPHANKWLVLHATQEWYDLYTTERTNDLQRFFDCYLKGLQNGWPETAPVRLALLNYTKPAIVDREFTDLPWHLPSAVSKRLFLQPDGGLLETNPTENHTLSYQADTAAELTFAYQLTAKTAVVGPSTLIIDVAAPDHDDLDIYTHIFKADQDGKILSNLNIPVPEGVPAAAAEQLTQNRLFRYWGPNGILRASQRHIAPELSGKTWKTLSHRRVEKVKPGDVVRLEVQLWPTGIVFEAGERLVLKVSGQKLGVAALPHLGGVENHNRGKHVLHLGPQSESHLQVFTLDV